MSGTATAEQLFDRVICGVDGSPESAEAARQAAVLAPPDRPLRLVTVVGEAELAGGYGRPYTLSAGEWQPRLEPALHALPPGRDVEIAPIMHSGPPAAALVEELEREGATLVALGGHDHRRLPGILLGSVAVAVLHDAPCSVLVARLDGGRQRDLRTIAAGFDGSPAAAAALQAAGAIADRLGAELSVVEDAPDAVETLRETQCDLLVVGSRGLHGVEALGSVSERVANTSTASVLVVR
jgi:nucleotide-binding universal stress UspA family protein